MSEPVVISNDPNESQPNRGFPLMGYETPRWSDPYHYCKLLNVYGVGCSLFGISP